MYEACLVSCLAIHSISSNLISENRIKLVIPTGYCNRLVGAEMQEKLKAKMKTIKGKQEGKQARKPNFSSVECTLLLTLAEENLDTIREKFCSF